MSKIEVRRGESIENALRRFKIACLKEGIPQEMKKREFYKAPSMIKKEKRSGIKRRMKFLQRTRG